MDNDCTRCGHSKRAHRKPTRTLPRACTHRDNEVENKDGFLVGGTPCECTGYTVAVLPRGERLEFGRHRLPQEEAETAPAWPPL